MKSKHTDEQLNWLRDRLPEYESRAAAQVRGDAKGFALRCAEEYIEKWGLGTGPDAEKESQVKERIYTWFKNTSARGKEARRKHAASKNDPNADGLPSSLRDASMRTPSGSYSYMNESGDSPIKKQEEILPFPENRHHTIPNTNMAAVTPPPSVHGIPMHPQQQQQPQQQVPYMMMNTGTVHSSPIPQHQQHPQQHSPQPQHSPQQQQGPPTSSQQQPASLVTAFLSPNFSPRDLAQVIASTCPPITMHHHSYPPTLPPPQLSHCIQSLLFAATTINNQHGDSPGMALEGIIELMKRYKAMIPHLPLTITHFGCNGPQAGVKALRVALRKNSTWIAYSTVPSVGTTGGGGGMSPTSPSNTPAVGGAPSTSSASPSSRRAAEISIHDQMHRNSIDRNRRKEYFIWSMIHSAAYEVSLLSSDNEEDDGSMKLAESVAKDGLWESDESDWVAGAMLLRAVIRKWTYDGKVKGSKVLWDELVMRYETRWKEVRDESRQQAMEDSINTMRKALDAVH